MSAAYDHVGTWRARVGHWPRFMPLFELDPERTALVIVDLQNYSAHPDVGWAPVLRSGFPEVAAYFLPRMREVVLPNTYRLLEFFRARRMRVVFLTVGPELPDGADFLPLRRVSGDQILAREGHRTIAARGTFEHEIVAELRPRSDELVLNKISRSAFTSTGIDQILRNLGIQGLVFCGTATDSCVETTARDAADRGYRCALVDDACVTIDQDSHDSTMKVFQRFFGRVMTTDEVTEHLSPARLPETAAPLAAPGVYGLP
jgi:biuret amidohydrolase